MQHAHAMTIGILLIALSVAGCDVAEQPAQTEEAAAPGEIDKASAAGQESSTGKPTAPIHIEYNVIGAAFVGQPVSIEIEVSSSLRDRPIALEYRINDPRALAFGDAQPARVALSAIGDAPSARRQVTVIPQREGRLYLNVSAEIETENGTLIKAMAIPVQVGSAPKDVTVNGELKTDADGDTVVSMPAEEN